MQDITKMIYIKIVYCIFMMLSTEKNSEKKFPKINF